MENQLIKTVIIGSISGLIAALLFYFLITQPNVIKDKLSGLSDKVIELETWKDLISKKVENATEIIERNETAKFITRLSIPSSNITDGIFNVNERRIDVRVSLNTKDNTNVSGYYLHIFQIESGLGQEYYYQGSASYIPNQTFTIPVYLGGESDYNKTYDIYAVVNNVSSYQKSSIDEYSLTKFPDDTYVVQRIQVKRNRN